MTMQTIIQEPEEVAVGSEAAEYTAEPSAASEIVVLENSETGVVTFDTSAYAGQPINRDLVVEFGDTLMGVHPNAQEIGIRGMRTVAHLALITGAHPLPGTNGIHAWRDKKGYLCIQFGIGFWRQQGTLAGGILWISRPRPMTDEERAEYIIAETQHASICIAALKRDAAKSRLAVEYGWTVLYFTSACLGSEADRELAIWQVCNQLFEKGNPGHGTLHAQTCGTTENDE